MTPTRMLVAAGKLLAEFGGLLRLPVAAAEEADEATSLNQVNQLIASREQYCQVSMILEDKLLFRKAASDTGGQFVLEITGDATDQTPVDLTIFQSNTDGTNTTFRATIDDPDSIIASGSANFDISEQITIKDMQMKGADDVTPTLSGPKSFTITIAADDLSANKRVTGATVFTIVVNYP